MHRCVLLAVILSLSSAYASAQRTMALTDLIRTLQQQGQRIVYSSNLVQANQTVDVDQVSMQSLEEALANLGFALEDRETFFVIVRAAGAEVPATTPVIERPVILESVIVTGSLHRFPYAGRSSSSHSFSIDEIGVQPTLASDPLRIANRLPGVSSLGVSAKPRIRGGLDDELLIMHDGVELLEPFHMADFHSVYSSIDYHTIESLDVYTGGFPSRYGNRMSGVMDIQSRARSDDHHIDLGLSTFANFINLRGEAALAKAANYLLSYREGDLSDLAEFIERRSGIPQYQDLSGQLNIALNKRWEIAMGATHASDRIAFEDEEESAASDVETSYAWLRVRQLTESGLRASLTASWLDFSRVNALLSFEAEEEKGGFLDHRQDISRLALRNDWLGTRGNGRYEFGWQLDYNRGDYRHRSEIDRGELADIIGGVRLETRDITEHPRGWAGGAYVQWELSLSDRLIVQPSIRVDFQDYFIDRGRGVQVSPRIGLAYQVTPKLTSRFSAGRFHQPEGIQELQVLDGIDRFFEPQYSDQAVVALDWQDARISAVAEIYYKHYGEQKVRFENIFNPFVLLPTMESDRVRLDPTDADARGLDLSLSLRLSPTITANARYSYMDARDRIDGRSVDRRWSQKNTVNAGIAWHRDGMSLSAAITWHSGWRTTLLPEFVAEDEVIPVSTVLNNTELRDFLSLDVSARKSWDLLRARVELYADVSNITDRRNQAGIDFDPEETDGGFELVRDSESLLGRVVSVGVTLSF